MTRLAGFLGKDNILSFPPNRTHVMAVVNLSPESRVRHSIANTPAQALERARLARDCGASIIDLGAQSSHFENRELSPEEELDRILPTLTLLVQEGFIVSIDTWKPQVAREAVQAGAAIVNDTGGMQHPEMVSLVAQSGVHAIMMYIEGRTPLTVGELDFAEGKIDRVVQTFTERLHALAELGVHSLILDPGLSINYKSDYNAYSRLQLDIIRQTSRLHALGKPVLIPVPRKQETHRMLAYLVIAIEYGANIIRVHDFEMACDLIKLFDKQPTE